MIGYCIADNLCSYPQNSRRVLGGQNGGLEPPADDSRRSFGPHISLVQKPFLAVCRDYGSSFLANPFMSDSPRSIRERRRTTSSAPHDLAGLSGKRDGRGHAASCSLFLNGWVRARCHHFCRFGLVSRPSSNRERIFR